MTKKSDKNMLIGLDIGTSKVVAIVGEVNPDGDIEIIGLGSHPSNGLKKGVVVNIESTVQSIQHAVEEAELMAGCEINSVYAGIAGSHIRSLNSHGIVAIREREVTSGDLDRVIDAARAVAIPADQRVLHILPQEFIIDDQDGIREHVRQRDVSHQVGDDGGGEDRLQRQQLLAELVGQPVDLFLDAQDAAVQLPNQVSPLSALTLTSDLPLLIRSLMALSVALRMPSAVSQ